MNTLTVGGILTNSFQRGMKNLIPVLVNTILWILTIWIPYLNVGTTIGLMAGVVAKMSRGETISMTEIFDPVYRKRMGEFFLVTGLIFMGTFAGFMFFIIPGYVISIAWMLAPLLVVDKEINPIEAINKSNTMTYGKKWTIFFGMLVIGICVVVALAVILGILSFIFAKLGKFGAILLVPCYIAGYAAFFSVMFAALSYIYGELNK
ncbi:MAG TPA: hypothetical protein PLA65_03700 [Spirochaetota bacterium]|nr:hypothetical protein [Spirochaetota bacterium]HOD16434.1 hypothetical protein [Spirochaetota bacterium]HPG51813.1 hypothetical protein [Spirochaetota bacterium]HPN11138.1 hypothetical protein [Spirochaetota bacterium]